MNNKYYRVIIVIIAALWQQPSYTCFANVKKFFSCCNNSSISCCSNNSISCCTTEIVREVSPEDFIHNRLSHTASDGSMKTQADPNPPRMRTPLIRVTDPNGHSVDLRRTSCYEESVVVVDSPIFHVRQTPHFLTVPPQTFHPSYCDNLE